MLPKGIDEQRIRKLSEIGKAVFGEKMQLPTEEEQEKAKAEIEAILKPPEGYVTIPYVRQVLTGLDFARTHFRFTMLDDIINGVEGDVADYKGVGTK